MVLFGTGTYKRAKSVLDDCLYPYMHYSNHETRLFSFSVLQTFLLEGEIPLLDFLGIVFGHIYHHCKTVNILRAPDFVIEWYNGDNAVAKSIRNKYKQISSDFEMQ